MNIKVKKKKEIERVNTTELESRLNYIERFRSLCNDAERFTELMKQGRLDQLLEPNPSMSLNDLLDVCAKGRPAQPIHITVHYII